MSLFPMRKDNRKRLRIANPKLWLKDVRRMSFEVARFKKMSRFFRNT